MLFTDTDNLNYEIKSEHVYEEFKHKHLFDLSSYPKDSKFFDLVIEKFVGKMKDVSEGKMTDEFVGLNWKMHSMKNFDCKESNTAKGVNIATEFNWGSSICWWTENEDFQHGISRFWKQYGRENVFSTLECAGNY